MSASADLQLAIETLLTAAGALRVAVPVIKRRTKDLGAEIDAACANHGLCIYVKPPLPTKVTEGAACVFVEESQLIVQIYELPPMNAFGADAYDLCDDVMTALHWKPFEGLLAHPLQLAGRPCGALDDPRCRIIEVFFNATYQLNPES